MTATDELHTIGVGIEVYTEAVDEAIEKVYALGDAFRNLKECTINVYASRNTWRDEADDDRDRRADA